MTHAVAFGIGCFHFGIAREVPFTFDTKRYVQDVREALEAISNVSEVTIDWDDQDYSQTSMPIRDEIETINESRQVFPSQLISNITFEIHIPFRVQKEILSGLSGRDSLFTETFRVSQYSAFHLPVTFIESMNPSQENDPSDAVVVVRELIRRAFANVQDGPIRLEVLGPSPFHANLFLDCDMTGTDDFDEWGF